MNIPIATIAAFILLFTAASLRAELGKSLAECIKIYGDPEGEAGKSYAQFSQPPFEVVALFRDDKCHTMRFRFFPEDKSVPASIPSGKFLGLLAKCKPGAEWSDPKTGMERIEWVCKNDPKVGALYGKTTKALYVSDNSLSGESE